MIPYVPKTGAELLDLLQTEIDAAVVNAGGSPVDWDNDVVLPEVVNAVSLRLEAVQGLVQAIADSQDPSAAQDIGVDDLLAMDGLHRLGARRSTATLQLTGTAGTVVGVGAAFRGGGADGKAEWVAVHDVTLDGSGRAEVQVEASEPGPVVGGVGSISGAGAMDGISTYNNAAAALVGSYGETDRDALLRRLVSLVPRRSRGIGALRARLLELPFLVDAVVLENTAGETRAIGGFATLPAHSVGVAVDPLPASADQLQQIGAILHSYGPDGIQVYGDGATLTVDGNGYSKTYGISACGTVDTTVEILLEVLPGFRWSDVRDAARASFDSWASELRAGSVARRTGAAGLETRLSREVEGLASVTVSFNGSPGADIVPDAIDRVVFSAPPVISEVIGA